MYVRLADIARIVVEVAIKLILIPTGLILILLYLGGDHIH
jgi:hypothetical protein